MTLGYDGNLYILAFDHRGSFQKKMFGIEGQPTPEDVERISDAKSVIFEGFIKARSTTGAPRDAAGMLVDEQFGADLARRGEEGGRDPRDARREERAGRVRLRVRRRLRRAHRGVRPDLHQGPGPLQPRGRRRDEHAPARASSRGLARGSTNSDRKFLFELLVPAEPAQLESVGGDEERYDTRGPSGPDARRDPDGARGAASSPDIWKIEGLDRREDCEAVAELTRSGGRDNVACVVLGRGADDKAVDHWLKQGAGVPGTSGSRSAARSGGIR